MTAGIIILQTGNGWDNQNLLFKISITDIRVDNTKERSEIFIFTKPKNDSHN